MSKNQNQQAIFEENQYKANASCHVKYKNFDCITTCSEYVWNNTHRVFLIFTDGFSVV